MRPLLALTLALLAPSALAHDARSAAVGVDVVGSLVTVHVAVTQAGLHHALEHAAGRPVDAGADDYRALVADHLRRTLRLAADGAPLAVGDVGLRLGGHQSDARFVAELPDGARDLTVTVESFDGVEGQQTVVHVRQGEATTRAVLSDADGWTASVPLAVAQASPTPARLQPRRRADGGVGDVARAPRRGRRPVRLGGRPPLRALPRRRLTSPFPPDP